MKILIKALIVLALFVIAMVAGPQILEDTGYVLVVFGNTAWEMTLFSVSLIAIAIGLGLWIFVRILLWCISLFKGSHRWIGYFGERKRQQAFYTGLQALASGDRESARKAFEKTTQGDFRGVNYLAAAQSATDDRKANYFLVQASEYPESKLAATIMQAKLLDKQEKPKEALALLDEIAEPNDKNSEVVKLKAQLLAKLNQWQTLQTNLQSWKKVLPKEEVVNWSQHMAKGKFAEIASKQGAAELKNYWLSLPRKQRIDAGLRAAYAEQLLDQGMHSDAQIMLVEWQKKGPEPSLCKLMRQLNLPNASAAITAIEGWIKTDNENADLYSTLGAVAFNSNDDVLAEKALLRAVKLNPNKEDFEKLSAIFERKQEPVKALHYIKQAYQVN